MLRRFHFLASLSSKAKVPTPSTFSHLNFSLNKNNQAIFKSLNDLHTLRYNFCSYEGLSSKNYEKDLYLLTEYSKKELAFFQFVLDRYTTNNRDLNCLDYPGQMNLLAALNQLGLMHAQSNNGLKALPYLLEEQYVSKKLGSGDTLQDVQNYYVVGLIYLTHDLEKAFHNLNEAIRVCKLYGEDPEARELITQSQNTLGDAYIRKGDEKKAFEVWENAIKEVEKAPSNRLMRLLTLTYEQMGKAYKKKKSMERAEDCWRKGLAISRREVGEDSERAFVFYKNLAESLSTPERSAEALPYAKKELELTLKFSSEESEDVAEAYFKLANAYLINEDYNNYFKTMQELANVYERLGKEYSRELGETYVLMANNSQAVGRMKESLDLIPKAIQAFTEGCCEDVGVAEMYFDCAKLLSNSQETQAKSGPLYQKALDMYRKVDPSNKQQIGDILCFLGDIAIKEQDTKKVLEILEEAEELCIENPADRRKIAMLRSQLGTTYLQLGDYDESIKYFKQLIKDFGNMERPTDIQMVGITYTLLGDAFQEKGVLDEALRAYQEGVKHNGKNYGNDHPQTLSTVRKMMKVMEKMRIESVVFES